MWCTCMLDIVNLLPQGTCFGVCSDHAEKKKKRDVVAPAQNTNSSSAPSLQQPPPNHLLPSATAPSAAIETRNLRNGINPAPRSTR